MGRLSLQSIFRFISIHFVASFDLVRRLLTRSLRIQLVRFPKPAWFDALASSSLSVAALNFEARHFTLPHIEDTDHPITRSLQGLAIGAATLFFVVLLLSLTASLQERVNLHIAQPQSLLDS